MISLALLWGILGAIYRDELQVSEFDMWKNMGVNPDLAMGLTIVACIATQCPFAWIRKGITNALKAAEDGWQEANPIPPLPRTVDYTVPDGGGGMIGFSGAVLAQ